MNFYDGRRAAYNEQRDGHLDEYLRTHDGSAAFPLFRGHEQFKMLWERGYLEPQVSIIRVMWNIMRDDEHYRVIDEKTLEGIFATAHGGLAGMHDAEKFLGDENCSAWEAQNLNPYPTPRVRDAK